VLLLCVWSAALVRLIDGGMPQVDSIDVSGIKPSRLANVGLLSARMTQGVEGVRSHVIDINMVVQVSEEGGKYIRCIFNPLD